MLSPCEICGLSFTDCICSCVHNFSASGVCEYCGKVLEIDEEDYLLPDDNDGYDPDA